MDNFQTVTVNLRQQKCGSYEECYASQGLQRNQMKRVREVDTTRALINRMRKRQATFFGHVMRREKLEHLVTLGIIERRRTRGK